MQRVKYAVMGRSSGGASAWFSFNRLLYQAAFVLIGVLAATGWSLYTGVRWGLSAQLITAIHASGAVLIIGYAALHVIAVLKMKLFLKMLRPRVAYGRAAALGLALAATAVGFVYMSDRTGYPELRIARVAVVPLLDGRGDDAAWQDARPVRILTTRGANLPNGESLVEIRAVHDGERGYFRFRWEDPERSQKMIPLVKEEGGWRVLQSRYALNDENDYYEDKFAVILSHRPALGSGTVHLGQDLFDGPHYRNPRGLHFTEDGSVVDLWHWKSIRSGAMRPGHADDNYIGPPTPSEAPGARYTGGYTQDPPATPHPYVTNFAELEPAAEGRPAVVIPRFLPTDARLLDRLGNVDLDPASHDEGTWYFVAEEVVPYSAELDTYAVGTVLPGIVLDGDFEGDRGDVAAEAQWDGGFWTLEVSRRLDTGSAYDVAIGGPRAVFLWTSVFNRTQTRHSQHLRPVRIVLD